MNGRVLFLLLLILKYFAVIAIAVMHSDSMNHSHKLRQLIIFSVLELLPVAEVVVPVSSINQNSMLCVFVMKRNT